MQKGFIVRADFYPNGEIVPLGITDGQGDTVFIQQSKDAFSDEVGTKRFECVTKAGKLCLEFRNGKWYVQTGGDNNEL